LTYYEISCAGGGAVYTPATSAPTGVTVSGTYIDINLIENGTPMIFDLNEIAVYTYYSEPLCNSTTIELLDALCTSPLSLPVATLIDLASPNTPGWSITALGEKFLVPTLII